VGESPPAQAIRYRSRIPATGSAMPHPYDTAVVGAGVFGAWTAWHLRRAGQRVLLVDQYGPASARASSGGETRVIRMAYGPDEVYTRLSQASLLAWKSLFAGLRQPDLFRETGVLWLAAAGDARAAQSLDVLARNHVRHEVLDAGALAQRHPQIAVPPGGWGLFEPESGALLARRAVQALVAACVDDGVDLRIDTVLPVQGGPRLDALRTASGEPVRAARYVFACGPWLGRVLPDVLGGRLFPTRQEVFYFGAAPGDTRFAAPALPVWLDSARDYYGLPDLDGRGFKLAHDAHGEPVDPDTQDRAPTPARIVHAREFLALRFPALADAPLLGAEVCQYENSSNGDLVLDRHPAYANAWIAGGGSGHGFKHGPAAAAYLVARMLDDGPVEARFGLAGKSAAQRREVH
jgi:monomeric sarcosine oxidase